MYEIRFRKIKIQLSKTRNIILFIIHDFTILLIGQNKHDNIRVLKKLLQILYTREIIVL